MPSARFHRVAILLATVAIAGGCAGLVVLPGADTDRELGAKLAESVREEVGLVEDPALADYLSAVGQRIAARLPASPFTYRFALVDQAEPNAFAAPGGYIYVSRGLLALARSEDELAAVLAHEIQHVERRHSLRQMQQQRRLGMIALPGQIVAGVVSEDLARLVGAPFALLGAGYGRDQEREADALGPPLAAAAGYEPAALAAILGRMERFLAAATEEKRAPSFFDSHPATPERLAALARAGPSIAAQRRPGVAADDAAFLARLDGLLLGVNPAEGVVRGSTFLHVALDLHIALPEGWKVINTRKYVAAVSPREDGIAILGVLGTGGAEDLPKLAQVLTGRVEKQYRTAPSRAGPTTVGGNPAWSVVLTDASGEQPVHVYFVWMAYRGLIYQVIGLSKDSDLPVVRAAGESIRPLTPSERSSITAVRLRLARARAGETLADLGRRTDNVLPEPLAAAMNDLEAGAPLSAGQAVKVAVRVPYRPGP